MANQPQPPVMNTTGKRLYVNKQGEVVERGEDAVTLIAAPGLQVLPEHVEAYNAYAAQAADEPDNNEGAPDAKAQKAAPNNKAIAGPQDSK